MRLKDRHRPLPPGPYGEPLPYVCHRCNARTAAYPKHQPKDRSGPWFWSGLHWFCGACADISVRKP